MGQYTAVGPAKLDMYNGKAVCVYLLSLGCPNITVSPSFDTELLQNTTLTCSSTGGFPSPSYHWLDGASMTSPNATVTVDETGPFFLTCVANSSHNGEHCIKTLNVSGKAVVGAFLIVFFILFFSMYLFLLFYLYFFILFLLPGIFFIFSYIYCTS